MNEMILKSRKYQQFKSWLVKRAAVRLAGENIITRIATGSTALFSTIAMSVAMLGMPTGLGVWIDMSAIVLINGLVMFLACRLLTMLLSIAYVPVPRGLFAAWLYTTAQTMLILYYTELELLVSIGLGLLYASMGVVMGLLCGLLRMLKWKPKQKRIIVLLSAFALGIAVVKVDVGSPVKPPARSDTVLEGEADNHFISVHLPHNPAEAGIYNVSGFSYGSGNDNHRAIFGDQVDIKTPSVDASGYITKWSKLKTLFWGFDQSQLPINGRVWMPEGDGPFPLVLIVHGNHLMEYFSDGGYDYLGELLASRGFIAVSVDANFLNYSVWSNIPNDDMKMRAWLLLKHLQIIYGLDQSGDSSFAGKVNWKQTALIGHSRGGQAVAMAADADKWFAEDKLLESIKNITIQSVIAIAPTDKRVEEQSARLTDVNYFVIQGAKDADVNNFYGDRQYNRSDFGAPSERFKASLYLADANHSQFNRDWGTMDERLPGGLFLNRQGLLQPEDQRLIAKVFISAFLEATLHGRTEYKALFQDYRTGSNWLPATDFVSRYEGADFVQLESYDSTNDQLAVGSGDGMSELRKEELKDRDGNGKGTSGMSLLWEEPGAVYEVELISEVAEKLEASEAGSLVFSLSNLEWELLSPPEESEEPNLPPLPEIEVVIVSREGEELTLELDELMPTTEPAYTSFLSAGYLEHRMKDNKYKNPVEAVYQTYIIPIDLFEQDTAIRPNEINSIQFRFLTHRGKVMMDDIGFLPEGGTYVQYRK